MGSCTSCYDSVTIVFVKTFLQLLVLWAKHCVGAEYLIEVCFPLSAIVQLRSRNGTVAHRANVLRTRRKLPSEHPLCCFKCGTLALPRGGQEEFKINTRFSAARRLV